ncbi:amino acid/amide ABC transporter substrate-binding protein (HAAT family) [Antricoccus suffuscus]|uniref:Amino acid/amide ABC transporter substrate-binding protein (HAAT family) n=1 Tax=Antricoccus suffuscus TaxID=1629062 RepID=A0A2T0ZZT3_9ACTN|nr:ABC transporter substrate-binding protein [Antricoccus suffuscus]PRZ41794.1 amino acid/amide ABC transporter substrate-binding protein (HAAT family) [Antricoccus suffuscus]
MKRRIAAVAVAGACIALTLTACGGRNDKGASASGCDTGITDSEINLGTSVPMSGAGAAYGVLAKTAQAYFDDLNADGGVKMGDGKTRKIKYFTEDDAYDPARTVSNVRKLVEQDKVFAIYSVLGTSPNLAISDYVNGKGIPTLFSQTGTDEFLNNTKEKPWIVGYLPQYQFEAHVMAQYVLDNAPNGKVGLLYQNDGFGKGMLANFEKEFKGTSVQIVGSQGYEQSGGSIDSQIVNLQNSGADVFLDYATGTFMTQSLKKKGELGWHPLTILTSGSNDATTLVGPAGAEATNGAVSFKWMKDVSDTSWTDDAGMKKWIAFATKHSVDPMNGIASSGYMTTQVLQKVLENTNGCKRQDMLDAVYSLSGVTPDLILPGVAIETKKGYPYILTQVQMSKFDGAHWKPEGKIIKHGDK